MVLRLPSLTLTLLEVFESTDSYLEGKVRVSTGLRRRSGPNTRTDEFGLEKS